MNITIIGAGFAGLASAIFLARSGHRITVLDRFELPQSVGAGILVQPSGLAVLERLGIAKQCIDQGARIEHLWGVSAKGRPVVDMRYEDWQAQSFGLGLHRGVLFHALWQTVQNLPIEVKTGQTITQLAQIQQGADLCIIADGAHSSLRAQTGLRFRDPLYPWGAVWAVLPDPARHYGSTLWQWYRHANQMLGIMPTGIAPAGALHAGLPVVSLFWSLAATQEASWRQRGLQAFKAQVLQLNPACAPLLEQIHCMEDLTWVRYRDVRMPRYHIDNSVIIGDAAHATSPQLGQGTNLALLDAWALDDCLRQHTNIAQALAAYTAARQPHLRFYGQASRWLTPLFQSELRLLPRLRDGFMAASLRWPILGPFTRQTLVGLRKSWCSSESLRL